MLEQLLDKLPQNHFLPDDSVDIYFTDPPYYNAIPYADLSDFFYFWQKSNLKDEDLESFNLEIESSNKGGNM